jgi:hypothetical protein
MSVVFYFMKGCPACEATWPTWRKVKKMAMGNLREMESKQIPSGKNVSSFPTFVIEDDNGLEVHRIVGSQEDAESLMTALKLKPKSKKVKGRRKTRRLRAGTTRRKIR